MMRIAVCDDIRLHAEKLAGYIADWAMERGIVVQIMKFQSGEEVLFEIEYSGDFTVVFLDIKLTGIDGVETATRIREQNRFANIVFVSQYEIYYGKMFKDGYPVLFLYKPLVKSAVFQKMDWVMEQQRYIFESFQFRYNHHTYTINLHEVMYFVSERRLVKIMLETGKEYRVYDKLDDIEGTLRFYRNPFVRIHQSYLVNGLQIEEYHCRMVMLRNNDSLPVSRGRKADLMRFHMQRLAKGG